MDLGLALLAIAVVAGALGAFGARFRRVGTTLRDLATGAFVGGLLVVVAGLAMTLAGILDRLGVLHLAFLTLVAGVPVALVLIAGAHFLDAEFRTPIRAGLLVAGAAGLGLIGLWSAQIEPTRLKVDEHGLGVSGVDQPIVIGVLADLHIDRVGEYERDAVAEVLAAEPDLVVMPGDLIDVDADELDRVTPEVIGLLRRLTAAVDLVVITPGHTDDFEALETIAESSGAVLLSDQVLDTRVASQPVSIAGLTHPFTIPEDDAPGRELTALAQLAGQYDEDELVVVVSHSPDPVLEFDEQLPVDLLIAGHTHGGQVQLPGIGPLFTGSEVPRVVAAGGLHLVNTHPVYVSTGVGMLRGQAPQVRFRSRPSVGVLTLVPS